jgi:FkbM family methyltransferase
MHIKNLLKNTIKGLRSSQPFNRIATSGAKAMCSLSGGQPEFLIKYLHRIDLVESKLPNGQVLKLSSKGDDWVSNQVFWRGWQGYEPETIPLFYKLAERSAVTFDVGAYVGFFTLLAAHANPNSRVFAFEPMKAIYQRLVQHVELNSLQNVTATFGAVGAEEGEAEFFHVEGFELPTSSSLSFEFAKDTEHITSTKVKVFQLDKFAKDNDIGNLGLMKIDTETTEPDVLLGATTLLGNHKPDIICEVLAGRAEGRKLKEILVPFGYDFYLLTPDGPVKKEEIEGHPDFLNYLFTKKGVTELNEILA